MEFPVSKLEMMRQSFLIRSFFVIPLFLCFLTYSQQQQQQQQLLPIPVLVNGIETTYALFFFSHTHTHILVGYKMEFSVFKLEMMRQSFLIRSFSIIPLFLWFLTCSQQQQQQLLPIPVLVNDVETTYALFLFFAHTHTHIALIYIPTHILVG
jgi:hypothetical protein